MWSIPGAMIRDDESYDQDGTVKIRPSYRVFNQRNLMILNKMLEHPIASCFIRIIADKLFNWRNNKSSQGSSNGNLEISWE